MPLQDLPEAGFFVESGALHAGEVATRDDSDDSNAVEDRQMPVATIIHHTQGVDCVGFWFQCVGLNRHDASEGGYGGVERFREDAGDGVAAGEKSGQPTVAFGDQDGADAMVPHLFTCLLDGGVDRKGDGILPLDDVRELPIGHFTILLIARRAGG